MVEYHLSRSYRLENIMKYFILILVLCVTAFSKNVSAKKHQKKHHSKSGGHKIVGGDDATIQEHPYQAFLLLSDGTDNYQCGGAIISTSYILSAAHCFKTYSIKSVTARIGSSNKFSGGEEYPGTFHVHEKYNSVTKDYDISFIKTDQEMTLDGVNSKAVPLIDAGTIIPSGSMLKLSGWGATSEGGDTSVTLRAVEVPSISNEECNEIQTVTSRQFCGGYKEGGKDTCQGDSGGPVVLSDSGVLAGVVSAGYGCARPNQPGIYTNITDLRSWVKENTGV